MGTVGLELLAHSIRAVRLGRSARTIEVPWDPMEPSQAVGSLSAWTAKPAGIRLAVGADFLEVKRVQLPPASAEARAHMVALAPERHFAVGRESLITAFVAESNLAFAANGDLISSWLEAFAQWGPIDCVEPAPVALARCVRGPGRYRLASSTDIVAIAEVNAGRVEMFRRLAGPVECDGARTLPDADVPASHVVARGVAAAHDVRRYEQLAPTGWTASLLRRQRRRLLLALAATLVGVLCLGWGADRWRERTLAALTLEAESLTVAAAPTDEALRRLASREAEMAMLNTLREQRPDPLDALAALSLVLPPDAVVRSLRVSSREWQVDGTTPNAAQIVPTLDRDGRFADVRFLSASSQFRDGARTLETFSIAYRYAARP